MQSIKVSAEVNTNYRTFYSLSIIAAISDVTFRSVASVECLDKSAGWFDLAIIEMVVIF